MKIEAPIEAPVAFIVTVDGTSEGDFLVAGNKELPKSYNATPLSEWQLQDLIARGYKF